MERVKTREREGAGERDGEFESKAERLRGLVKQEREKGAWKERWRR